ncbi:MAG: XdhC family protein [Bacteroidota bacterium]
MTSLIQHLAVWQFLLEKLEASIPAVLLLVIESHGSSPGRQRFKMVVSNDGQMKGSIGGGIMEHKLVELARSLLEKQDKSILFKKQVHRPAAGNDRSGMICSGEQVVVIVPLATSILTALKKALASDSAVLQVSATGLSFLEGHLSGKRYITEIASATDWTYREDLFAKEVIHIIGGGHVGQALSRQMSILGFYVKLYDNRPGLNTMASNTFANEKRVVEYDKIADQMDGNTRDYVVIMTFGYRDDKIVLKQLLNTDFVFLGMMGSKAKIEQLFHELKAEGFSEKALNRVRAPVGVAIASKTPAEIGVSIAAEILRFRNLGEIPLG